MILGIDATNWVHVLWHARPGFGVLDALRARVETLANALKPSHVLACFDRRSFRHDLFAGYKANRPDRPAELVRVLDMAAEKIQDSAQIVYQDGFEADDCLATAAAVGRAIGQKVVIASPDKDLRQCLVDGVVTILRGFAAEQGELRKPDWLTAKSLIEKYGVTPAQWPEYQALVGDPGDGVPGCPGIGAKTAASLLGKFGTLAAMFSNPLALPISASRRVGLMNWRKNSALALQLVTLRTDVPAVVDAMR